jgi:hypothetical protein
MEMAPQLLLLPSELRLSIYAFLHGRDLCTCMSLNRQTAEDAKDGVCVAFRGPTVLTPASLTEALWKELCTKRWGHLRERGTGWLPTLASGAPSRSWRAFYQVRCQPGVMGARVAVSTP